MSEIDKDPARIVPYLNPAYWDGHGLGIGETSPPQPLLSTSATRKFARLVLEERLQGIGALHALEQYGDGTVFNPAGYEPGTVVLMREEFVNSVLRAVELQDEWFEDMEVPVRPRNLEPSLGVYESNSVILGDLSEHGLSYMSTTRWGVVSEGKKRNPVVQIVSTSDVHKLPQRVFVGSVLPIAMPRIHIGETEHTVTPRNRFERLQRINYLEVIAYGAASRKRSLKAVSRLAINGI